MKQCTVVTVQCRAEGRCRLKHCGQSCSSGQQAVVIGAVQYSGRNCSAMVNIIKQFL